MDPSEFSNVKFYFDIQHIKRHFPKTDNRLSGGKYGKKGKIKSDGTLEWISTPDNDRAESDLIKDLNRGDTKSVVVSPNLNEADALDIVQDLHAHFRGISPLDPGNVDNLRIVDLKSNKFNNPYGYVKKKGETISGGTQPRYITRTDNTHVAIFTRKIDGQDVEIEVLIDKRGNEVNIASIYAGSAQKDKIPSIVQDFIDPSQLPSGLFIQIVIAMLKTGDSHIVFQFVFFPISRLVSPLSSAR